jgi:hypothetical protein
MTDNLHLELKNEINKYMDCQLYDQENWTNRNEKFGNGAILTLTAEGTLNQPNPSPAWCPGWRNLTPTASTRPTQRVWPAG